MMYLSIRHPAYLCEVYRVYASWYVTIYATLSTLLALIYDSATTTTGSWEALVVGRGEGGAALDAVRCKENKLANSKGSSRFTLICRLQ